MIKFKKWIGAVVLLLALILISGFYINKKAGQIVSQRQLLIDQNLALEFLSSLKSDAEEAEKNLAGLEKILPNQEPKEDFSTSVEAFAKKRSLTATVNFGEPISGNELQPSVIDFKTVAGGSYSGIVSFLRDIRAGQFLVKFINIDLEQKSKSFEANIQGQIFYE